MGRREESLPGAQGPAEPALGLGVRASRPARAWPPGYPRTGHPQGLDNTVLLSGTNCNVLAGWESSLLMDTRVSALPVPKAFCEAA